MRSGDSFKIRSNLGVQEDHLHFVLTDPYGHPEHVILVNMTSTPCDEMVVLNPIDHPQVKHASYIWFAQSTKAPVAPLTKAFATGLAVNCEPSTPQLLKKLRQSFLMSDEVPRDLKKELVDAIKKETVR